MLFRQRRHIWLDPMPARLAPHDQSNMRGERVAQRHQLRLAFFAARCHIRFMPTLDLTEDEHAELVRVVRLAIEADHFFLAPRAKRLRRILSKLNPAAIERAATPLPPPKPAGKPSLVYQKLKGGRRRR